MNAVKTLKDVLFHEMEVGVRSTVGLLQLVKDEHWDYHPAANMRNLRELAVHLVAIPEVDLNIMQEKDRTSIQSIEARYDQLTSAEEMGQAMEKGYGQLNAYFASLSDEAFLTKKTKPFYLDEGSTQARWLTETTTHIFHHRAQLFNYMKQLGYEVNMFNLYV